MYPLILYTCFAGKFGLALAPDRVIQNSRQTIVTQNFMIVSQLCYSRCMKLTGSSKFDLCFCQTPDLGLGLGVDFTFGRLRVNG